MKLKIDPPFLAPKLKIKRANNHIQEFQACLDTFLKTDFYSLHINKNFAGHDVLTLDSNPLPCEIPLIIGDIIHNLRSSLDIMACEIVTKSGNIPSRNTYFPISDTRDKLISLINSGEIKMAGQDICDLIADFIKPYRGGNDSLWSLHQLGIIDKHRLLIPVVSVTQLTGVCAYDDNNNQFIDTSLSIGEGVRLNAIATSANLHITSYGKPTFGIFFGKGDILENHPIFPTLHHLAQAVSGVIQTIEEGYIARG